MGFTSEQQNRIKTAENIDLASFLMNNGISLTKKSNEYRHSTFSSLVIKDNRWYWFKHFGQQHKDSNGNAIDYLTNDNFEFRYDFNKAVEELNKFGGVLFLDPDVESKNFNINNVELTKNLSRSIAYLNKTRGIDNKIIDYLIKNKLIAQTKKNNNLAFLIKDENKNVVGMELNTTLSNRRFKGLEKNSKYGYGFNITNTKRPKNALYFESAIDLISFIQYIGIDKAMKKLDTCIFISLSGLKENILNNFQNIYNNPSIFLCTDNINIDKASKMFVGQIQAKYRNVNLYLPTSLFKDWNDVIQNKI